MKNKTSNNNSVRLRIETTQEWIQWMKNKGKGNNATSRGRKRASAKEVRYTRR